MATKSERFRYWMERSGPKKAKQPPRPRRDFPVDTSLPGVSASDRRAGGGSMVRNWSLRAARKASYALEDAPTGRPSRKSTRRSSNRIKSSHPLVLSKREADRRESLTWRGRIV